MLHIVNSDCIRILRAKPRFRNLPKCVDFVFSRIASNKWTSVFYIVIEFYSHYQSTVERNILVRETLWRHDIFV